MLQGVRDWRVPDDRRMAAPVIQRRASTGSSEASMSRQGSGESGRRESHRVRRGNPNLTLPLNPIPDFHLLQTQP